MWLTLLVILLIWAGIEILMASINEKKAEYNYREAVKRYRDQQNKRRRK
jgi:uncharacterized membrane protein